MLFIFHSSQGSKSTSFVIVTDYRLSGLGSIHNSGRRFFSNPQLPEELWGLPSHLLVNTGDSFPRSKAAEAWGSSLILF
jgi:hypothetical protein